MSNRRIPHQSESYNRRRKYRVVTISVLAVVIIVSWVFAFVRFTRLQVFNIREVTVSGTSSTTAAILQATVSDTLDGYYLGLIPKSNIFLYPRSDIIERLKKVAREIDRVDIERTGTRSLKVDIIEKKPAAIVCTGYPDFTSTETDTLVGEGCYLADSSGYIYGEATTTPTGSYHLYYDPLLKGDDASTTDIIGEYATTTPKWKDLETFYESALNGGVSVRALLMKDAGEYELYVDDENKLRDSGGVVVVYLNDDRRLGDELTNLLAFWSVMATTSKSKTATTSYDYIDVRYGANVFYK